MTRFRYLSFLTDYGLEDGFVAACHGVAARIAPHASIIDVTHLIPPGDVRRGAAVLAQTVPYLPPAVHVAVVDPGVGTARRGVAVAAGDSVFVGPDNGLLSWAVAVAVGGGAARAFSLTNRELWLANVTATFHGRDIFMPVAAHLAGDAELAATGAEIDVADLVTLPVPERRIRDSVAEGEVLTVDRFGNVQLTITASDAAEIGLKSGGTALIRCGRHELAIPYRDMFGAVGAGELVAYGDSAGLVSIAVNGGDAAQRLGLPPGARVSIAAAPLTIRLIRAGRIPPGPGAWHDYIRRPNTATEAQAIPARPPPRRRNLTKVSHRLRRGTLLPFTTGLTAALTVLGTLGPAIAAEAAAGGPAATPAGHGSTARGQEWWLSGLNVTQVWPQSEGAGITVAVLGTGVDTSYPGLAGSVITGPDYTGSDRAPGSPYWGVEGTAVAGVIAAHARGSGLAGVAPDVKILSIRVTLEFNDPLASNPAISRRLPQAIADGITYATDHGARVIDLPLDPGTLGLTSKGDPAAAGGSPAERAAVSYAQSKGVVLVAPAGDDGEGSGIVNYPAAYPGVIAVGAIARTGQLAAFSSKRPYTSLTAPGVSMVTAAPPDSYGTVSSTSIASGIVTGVAALILSKFPHLTVAQATRALIESTATTAAGRSLPPLPARSSAGAGYGTVDAVRAVDMADVISTASQPGPTASAPVVPPRRPAHHAVAAPHRAAAPQHPADSTLAGSVLRDAVAAVAALIVLLVIALLVLRSRRNRGDGNRTRAGGQHQHRRAAPPAGVVPVPDDALAARRPGTPAGWAPSSGWQGGGIGEIRPAPNASFGSAAAPAARPSSGSRTGRAARRADADPGPPWAPAPEPGRGIGPLPVASAGPPLPDPSRGIRVPGDMASAPSAEPAPPASFDLTTPPAGFDLSTPAFGLTPPSFGAPPPIFDAPVFEAPVFEAPVFEAPVFEAPVAAAPEEALPTRASLGFAAAPVPADFAAPPAEGNPQAAPNPGYIWDLSATDVFPPASSSRTEAAGAAAPEDDGAGLDES